MTFRPARKVTTEQKPNNVSVHIDVSCPICQEPVGQRTPEGTTESWSQLPCGHKFGSRCIKHWLGMVARDRPCCPLCRQSASHSCGHPVLPEVVANNHRPKSSAAVSKLKTDTLQFTKCPFCRSDAARPRKRKRGKPWRFVKGCWRLVRHGRVRERNTNTYLPTPFSVFFPQLRDIEWERWWKEQEPKNA